MQHLDVDQEHAQDTIAAIYDRFALIIFTFVQQQVSHPQDAEDILLEVFVAALKHSMLCDLPPERQLAWLKRVARNKVIDRYRHQKRVTTLALEQIIELEDAQLTPEEHAEQHERYAQLAQAVQHLSPLQQHLLYLRYVNGLRPIDIAAMLDKSEGTIRSILSRTLVQLRRLFARAERSSDHETSL